jgi:hypothetical protein
MGYALFFLAVVAACLLWSAAFTAGAARARRAWLRRLLLGVAVVVPIAALSPWVIATWLLAFRLAIETNWFGPTVSCAVAALVGGIWIAAAGMSRRPDGEPAAAAWPVIGLAGLFVIAKMVAFGILLILDNAMAAQSPYMRLEAASLIQAHLPPAVPDAENAAPLYREAFARLDMDAAAQASTGPLPRGPAADVTAEATRDLLQRHAATLDLLRAAADRDTCRFDRDWTRPSFDMILPEIQAMRNAARLLAIASVCAAADGDVPAALQDVARIARMGHHAASEPLLISGLVGLAIDGVGLDTLARVLPACTPGHAAALLAADPVGSPPTLVRSMFGEEAFGLATFADVADARLGLTSLQQVIPAEPGQRSRFVGRPGEFLYRVFLLPADIDGYRRFMHRQQQSVAQSRPFAAVRQENTADEEDTARRRPGLLSALIMPALGQVRLQAFKAEARHAAATALVAATRQRLSGGTMPESLDAIDREWLPVVPADPYTGTTLTDRQPLRSRSADGALVVWSVGPDGEDDGGPVPAGADAVEGNDDIGLRLESAPAAVR